MRFRGYQLTIRGAYAGPIWDFLGTPDEIKDHGTANQIHTWFFETKSERDSVKRTVENILMVRCSWIELKLEIN